MDKRGHGVSVTGIALCILLLMMVLSGCGDDPPRVLILSTRPPRGPSSSHAELKLYENGLSVEPFTHIETDIMDVSFDMPSSWEANICLYPNKKRESDASQNSMASWNKVLSMLIYKYDAPMHYEEMPSNTIDRGIGLQWDRIAGVTIREAAHLDANEEHSEGIEVIAYDEASCNKVYAFYSPNAQLDPGMQIEVLNKIIGSLQVDFSYEEKNPAPVSSGPDMSGQAQEAGGSSVMVRGNAQRTGAFDTKGLLELHGLKFKYVSCDSIGEPIVWDGKVFCSNDGQNDKRFLALDADTGEELWLREDIVFNQTEPCIFDGIMYLSAYGFSAIDCDTGNTLWEAKESSGTPCIEKGMLYFSSADHFHARDARTFEEEWRFVTGDDRLYGLSDPCMGEGLVFVGAYNCLLALDQNTGKELWIYERSDMEISLPVYSAGFVYLMKKDCTVFALDLRTGNEAWAYKTGEARLTAPCIADGTVFFGEAEKGILIALDQRTGSELWRFDAGTKYMTSPVYAGGAIYFGSTVGIIALDASSGLELWRFADAKGARTPWVENGVLYFAGSNHLYALE